jgi:RNA polymerase sigma factor (sigma-70 family)
MQELEILITTKEEREVLFTDLYKKAFPSVAAFISRKGGNFDEAKDIFQDALVIYYEKSQDVLLEFDVSEKAYIVGICKNLWKKRFESKHLLKSLDSIKDSRSMEENDEISSDKLLKFLERAGKKCMEILKAFYYDKLDASQIASSFGFAGTRSASVQKFKCLEKVRDQVKEKSLGYEDFTE